MAAASLTLGLIHCFIWIKQRGRYAYLLFFILATLVLLLLWVFGRGG